MDLQSTSPSRSVVALKAISVWMTETEKARFKRLADERGVSASALLKQLADNALTPADPTRDFRRLSADLRSDVSQVVNKIAEQDALASQGREQAIDDIRDMLNGFLRALADQQVAAVLGAVKAGQGSKPAQPPKRDPTPAELGLLPPSPPPLS